MTIINIAKIALSSVIQTVSNGKWIKSHPTMLEAAEAPVKKEHDLQIRETRKTSGEKPLSDVEVIRRKEANVTKKKRRQG